MQWASTGHPLFLQESLDEASDADSSEDEIEKVMGPQTPKPKIKQRQKEQEKGERELRK